MSEFDLFGIVEAQPRRILVTGSREFTDASIIHAALDEVVADGEPIILLCGGARGADSIAEQWGSDHPDLVTVELHPAQWERHGKKAAGMIRNAVMIKTGPELVLAFLSSTAQNVGTRACMQLAVRASIPIREFHD